MFLRQQFSPLTTSLGLALAAGAAIALLLGGFAHTAALAAPNEWRVCNSAGGYSTTIQSAVDAAQPGDIIKVAAGIYTESRFAGGDFNLVISKTVHLFGGYTCADWATQNPAANVVTIRPTTTRISVVAVFSLSPHQPSQFTPTIDGFTISGGGGGNHGGGMRLVDSNALIQNNVIADNVGYLYGGGIWVQRGAPTISNNRIENNRIDDAGAAGGGIELEDTQATLRGNLIAGNVISGPSGTGGGLAIVGGGPVVLSGNTILGNTAASTAGAPAEAGQGGGVSVVNATLMVQGGQVTGNQTSQNCEGFGGGLYATASDIRIDSTRFDQNCAGKIPEYGLGGALAFLGSTYTLTNLLIVDNLAAPLNTVVGGVYAGSNSSGLMVNNTIANNQGQAIRSASPLILTNNIIMGHTTGISATAGAMLNSAFNDLYQNGVNERGVQSSTGNMSINPRIDATYHLLPGSPVIDAGTRLNAPDHDSEGQPRPMMGGSGTYRFDIGADEFTGVAQTVRDLNTQPADFTLIGPGNPTDKPGSNGTNDWIGSAVGAGDINADGKADLLVGAANLSGDFDGGTNDDGRVFALYDTGARRLGVLDLYTATASLEVRSWLHQQHIGQAFANGDLNGDGKQDLMIGASGAADVNVPGTVFIFTGSSGLGGVRTLSPTMQANVRIRSDQNTATFGVANALASGQLDGTGPDDLVVGEAGATVLGRKQAGAVYVFFGGSSLPALWDMRVLSPSLSIFGSVANGQMGRVAIADINGDGKPDLVARSPTTVYVFYGPLSGGIIDLLNTPASLTIGGLADGQLAAGDVDGDGKADIIVGDGNRVVVIRGSNGTTLATFTGVSASALLALDWNGDGKAEVVMSDLAQRKVFVVNSSATLSSCNTVFECADTIITAGNQSQFGYALGGGDLDGDGVPDLMLGSLTHGAGDHPLSFQDAGAIYVLYGSAHAR